MIKTNLKMNKNTIFLLISAMMLITLISATIDPDQMSLVDIPITTSEFLNTVSNGKNIVYFTSNDCMKYLF